MSPLFDVVSAEQLRMLYDNPYNSIHLSVPSGNEPAKAASFTLEDWKHNGIITQDVLPGIYVYYQYFSLPGGSKTYCRKGIVCHLKVYDWDEKVLLRHENTIPRSVKDRTDLLRATKLNASATHGLYTDAAHCIEPYLDESMLHPIYDVEDYQGVRNVLSVIHDYEAICAIQRVLAGKQIILADGHHRYEGALSYAKSASTTEALPYHLIYLTNTESDDLQIRPTHRIIQNRAHFDSEYLLQQLERYFDLMPLDNPMDIHEVIAGKKNQFGLVLKDRAVKITLKAGMIDQMTWKFPTPIKQLDLTVLHYFVFEKILGIKGEAQRNANEIVFERNETVCHQRVNSGEAQAVFFTNGIAIDTVKEVCYSGYTLPQKSTYFYPKVVCGYLFSTIDPIENNEEIDRCF